jgi:outer membrane protein OmpA-like peptidoglycan-associated protein
MAHFNFRRSAAAGLALISLAACAGLKHGPLNVAQRCHDESLTLYFDTASDALTDAGRQLVSLTARRLRSCQVRELKLVGLSDPAGSPDANLQLSERRANNVLDAFVRAGTQVPKYTLVARGDAGAVAASGAVEPVRRRVDVTLVVGR